MSYRNNNNHVTAQPPKGYIAGLGRGAAGFTTRSDIGPMSSNSATAGNGTSSGSTVVNDMNLSGSGSRASELREVKFRMRQQQQQQQQQQVVQQSPFGVAPKGYIVGAGRGAPINNKGNEDGLEGGQSTGSMSRNDDNGIYEDDDDIEADLIYEAVDERMSSRRSKRKARNVVETKNNNVSSATARIGDQFRELKEKLTNLTDEQWENIPDVLGDYSLRHKQKRREDVFTPISDSLLGSKNAANAEANGRGLSSSTAVVASADPTSGYHSVISNISGYLTSLSTIPIASKAEVNDINKARLLLKSVRDTNPKHAPAWIASARVEETANKIHTARKLIQDGCEACPTNEDLWLEASRLHPPPRNKVILASAIQYIPKSVKIFIAAADLESNIEAKKVIFRKALESIPTSTTLWKAAIDLEEEEGALLLLQLATEKVPHCVDFWLASAKLETYEQAKKVLNQARKALPAEKAIWITAAKLEESHGEKKEVIDKIIQNGLHALKKNDAVISREQWLKEAERTELVAVSPITSASIVKYTIGIGVDPEDRLRTWSSDATTILSHGAVGTARAILAHALASYPTKKNLWIQAVELEQNHGTNETLDEVLKAASERLPRVELFWLIRAKEKWCTTKDIPMARQILTSAFAANPDSESVWLAAAKLEWETNEIERARVLLTRARERAPTARVYMKSALLERENDNFQQAITLIKEGIQKYSIGAKLYMMGGQISYDNLNNIQQARKFYQEGLENCSKNVILWNLASSLEENHGNIAKARSLFELARLKNPKSDYLWLQSIRFEARNNSTTTGANKNTNNNIASSLMSKALKECPKSGLLLSESIRAALRVEQKSKSAHAIQKGPDDPYVILAVASLFASERKVSKARKWFERSILLNTDIGDHWARYYIFECEFGTTVEVKDLIRKRCIDCEPKHGEIWCSISKMTKHRRKSVGEILDLVVEHILSSSSS